jgi:NADH:ubiquinone oxidoreductase subunit 5 (subunit L)/multisubunit Na+/H+ antiporter MnhA subunit
MLYLFAILPPALAALFVSFTRTTYSRNIRAMVPVAAVGLSFAAACTLFYKLLSGPFIEVVDIGTWFSISTFQVNLSLLIDSLSIVMLLVITSYPF